MGGIAMEVVARVIPVALVIPVHMIYHVTPPMCLEWEANRETQV
jgi:hypothetical protein